MTHSDRKSDKVDAEKLARYARLDPEVLRPIAHRTAAAGDTDADPRSSGLVGLCTGAVNSVTRSAVWPSPVGTGCWLPPCSP
jgi:hypothetical protein